jgi:peptidoglycan/xylan/chitin deacetylase (PgdA/CDA1 family)
MTGAERVSSRVMQLRGSRVRRRIKAALGHVLYRTGLYRLAWRNRAIIVLFHRIDDRYPEDPITCTRRMFGAFCDFFKRYFDVISLGELLVRLRNREDISGSLVITFDDGYRDNYTVAAPELERQNLRACFFIATGFIGSEHIPWWDAQWSIPSQWMTWDEVRALRDRRFDVGAHTITHVDCGRLSRTEAVEEIVGSKAKLETETGSPVAFFAYPYGGPEQMTEENRSIVREAGFECCMAAYGGVVARGDDPLRLKRAPINNWYLSPYQFGFEAARRGFDLRSRGGPPVDMRL